MLNIQDLPDEVFLKIFGSSETKDLLTYVQVSKRIRKISHDSTLWVTANLWKKIVKTELLEMILSKGCRILNLSNSTIVGSLSSNMKPNIRSLDLSQSAKPGRIGGQVYCEENIGVLEELLFSSCSLQHLKWQPVSVRMAKLCKD